MEMRRPQAKMKVTPKKPFGLDKEWRLIGALLIADWSAAVTRTWDPDLFTDVDWPRVAQLGWQYKVRPMMAAALREAGWPGVPSDVRAMIAQAERQCCLRAVSQMQLLIRLIAAADSFKIRVLALKGVALSLRLYGDPFIREAMDLDILVHPDDSPRLQDIARALDCRPFEIGPRLTPRQSAVLERHHHDRKFIHNASGTSIEIHHRLDDNQHRLPTDFEALWAARDMVPLPGAGAVAVMGEADLVHYLIVHAARHGWTRWKWLADLAALGRGADMARVCGWRQRAALDGNEDIFDSWLLLCKVVTDSRLPGFEAAQGNRRARALAARALRCSVRERNILDSGSVRFTLSLLSHNLRLKPKAWLLGGDCECLFIHEEDWYTLRLPDKFLWLHYVLRPFLLLWRRLGVPMAASIFKRVANARASRTQGL
jgi:hypothetical protein